MQSPCPSGRYGAAPGLNDEACSGPCDPGFECPPGSLASNSSQCPQGFYCAGGPRRACPAGRFSSEVGTQSLAACVACAPGRFGRIEGAISITVCAECQPPDGSYANSSMCWPGLVSVVASNPPPLVVGFSAGDVVVLNFSARTNMPPAAEAVVFTPSIGLTSASWRAGGKELHIVVLDTLGVPPPTVDVAAQRLTVTVSGIALLDGTSPASPPMNYVVGGTWGAPAPPELVSAVAVDTGRNVGLDTGDSLLLIFDQVCVFGALPACNWRGFDAQRFCVFTSRVCFSGVVCALPHSGGPCRR
jgi:hypothetical protein